MFLLAVLLQSAAPAPEAPCKAHPIKRDEVSELRVVCGGNGARIGEMDSYEAATNRETGALAIRILSHGSTRVLLVLADASGRPFVQDLTRDLARAAGRHGDSGIGNAPVDLEIFTGAMTIGVGDQLADDSPPPNRWHILDLSSSLRLSQNMLAVADTTPPAGQVIR